MIKKLFNRIKNLKQKNTQKGFTLLETLVAIFILTLSITGPVYIASLAFRNTIDSRDNISAQYIAEEIVEVIKNKRDGIVLNGETLDLMNLFGTGVNCDEDSKCTMNKETTGYVFESCGENCPNISFDPTSLTAVYGSDTTLNASKFVREFYVVSEQDSAIKVVVNIKWNDKGREKVYTLTERLYKVDYSQFFVNQVI